MNVDISFLISFPAGNSTIADYSMTDPLRASHPLYFFTSLSN